MFNGRTFYGQELGVTMDKESHKDIRPHGLIDVGPGLGKNGKPVINIAEQYDILVNKQTTQLNSLLFAEIDCDVDDPQGCDPNQNVRSENGAAAEPITVPNNRPMPSQNLVLNPINLVQAVVRDFKDRNPRTEGYVPALSAQNILPPHAPNPIQVGVNSESLPNFPNVNVPPPHMLQNANMHWNPPPQPIAMAQNVVLQPQGLWHNNAYQLVPPVPLVPNQMWPQAPVPENGMIPNINVAQNHNWGFFSIPAPAVNTAPNVPHYISDNVCVTEYPREVVFQNVPNPIMNFTRPETSTNVLNNVHPNVLNPILKPTRPEIPTTVILNNIPPSTLDVLLERLNPCGHLLSVYCPHPRRAVATFATPEQAERCFLMYNGYVAGDCAIDVTYALKQ